MTARVRTFGAFQFHPGTGELFRGGVKVELQNQPARVLELLTRRPGELVTRDELREAIWGGDTYVDFDRSLNFCIRRIRIALPVTYGTNTLLAGRLFGVVVVSPVTLAITGLFLIGVAGAAASLPARAATRIDPVRALRWE